MKIYPTRQEAVGTSIATALEGKVKLEGNPKVPETKFNRGERQALSIRFRQATTRSSR